jgi:hypothetical protein
MCSQRRWRKQIQPVLDCVTTTMYSMPRLPFEKKVLICDLHRFPISYLCVIVLVGNLIDLSSPLRCFPHFKCITFPRFGFWRLCKLFVCRIETPHCNHWLASPVRWLTLQRQGCLPHGLHWTPSPATRGLQVLLRMWLGPRLDRELASTG